MHLHRLLLLLALGAGSVLGQLDRGTITGTITDATGAVIPAAPVLVIHSGTGSANKTQTNESGQYNSPNLPIGTYEVRVEVPGFKTAVRRNIEVGVTQVLRVDLALEVGTVSDAIEVTTEITRVQSETPEVGTALSTKSLLDLPLSFGSARLPETFAYKIAPGVAGDSWAGYIAGSTAFSKETILDGATVATNRSGHFGESSVSIEALGEFKVMTSGISAEFGRVQVGVFNYVMKSGTNELHGSAYGGLRNEALNANTFVNNFRGRPRNVERKQNYAGSLGGPVVLPKVYNGRNKSFFYATWEHFRERTGGFGAPDTTVPLPEFYEGDFSRLLGPATSFTDGLGRPVYRGAIYDPRTFRQLSDGTWVGDPFPGNRIPVNRFSAVSRRLNELARGYVPTVRDSSGQFALVNNAAFPLSGSPRFDQYNFSVKGDQILAPSHKLSGSWALNRRPRFQTSSGYGRMWDPEDPEGGLLSGARYQVFQTHLARLAYDWIVTPTILNHAVVYGNRSFNHYGNDGVQHGSLDGAALLGIQGVASKGFPGINWGGGPFVTLTNPGDPVDEIEAFFSGGFLNTVSFSKGRHFMKAGFEHRRYQVNFRAVPAPYFNFSARSTAIPNAAFAGNQTGYAFASYLLGIVDSASMSDPVGTGGRRRYYAGFFQDDFKVSSRLTLNLGLRWDFQPPTYEVADRYSSWNPNKIDPISGLPGAYDFAGDCSECTGQRYFGVRNYKEFGPRIGFALRLTDNWTIRSAYGIMYEGDNFNGSRGTPTGKSTQTAWGGTWALGANAIDPWRGLFQWDNGFPTEKYMPAARDVSWGNFNSPTMIHPDYGRSPYIQQWNFNVQRQIAKTVIDVGYVGNKATRLRVQQLARLNQLPWSYVEQFGTKLTNPVRSAEEAAANGIRYPYPGFRGTVASALRQYPQVQGNSTITMYGAPMGFSSFHSMQLIVNRQFSRGFSVYGNYVWSKTMANAQSSEYYNNPGRPLDYYNLKLEKAVSEHDIPHMLKAFVDYELPVGRGRLLAGNANRWVNGVIGGWHVSAIVNYFSGWPLGFGGSFPLSNGWNGAVNRANIAPGNMKATGFSKDNFDLANPMSPANTYLNRSLFSDPAPLTLGTAAFRYTQIRGFGTINEDVAIQKEFRPAEKYRIQLRGEFFNALNRHQLSNINTSVTSPQFGQVTGVSGNRTVQINMRLDF